MTFGDIHIWTCIILFVVFLVFDGLYTLYVQAITELKAFKASILSTILYLISVFGTIEYIHNFAYVIPIALAGFLGTFLTIKYTKQKSEKQNKGD